MMTQSKSATQTLEQTMNRLVDSVKTEAVFGQPVQRDGITIIPCSEVSLGLGLGGGNKPHQQEAGENMSGGGGVSERPIAVIVVTHNGVRVQPIPNVTKIAVSFFSALGFAFLLLGQRNQNLRMGLFARQMGRAPLGKMLLGQQLWSKRQRGAGFIALTLARRLRSAW
jgi:uncharacterized spore protein YtfJ